MSIAMDEEAIGEHELKLRNLLATLHTDVDLSRPQGSENRDMQVFERRLFEAEDLVQRTKIDAVSKLQEKRVEQYREDLTKLREQLGIMEDEEDEEREKSEKEPLMSHKSPIAVYGIQTAAAEDSLAKDEEKATCSCTNMICYVIFDCFLECCNDCNSCCTKCPTNCMVTDVERH